MTTLYEIQNQVNEAARQSAAIAQQHNSGEMRILAIAISETAQAVAELAKHVRNLER